MSLIPKVTTVTSKAMPVPMKDVDTDLIIPAQFLTSISKDGYGANVFRRLRDNDPNFPINRKEFDGASILVTDSNFGCGSSREHAVWALTGAGFKVVIAKSFSDIFYNNSAKNALLLVVLEDKVVDEILQSAKNADYEVTVDLESQTVVLPDGRSYKFEYDQFRKHCMLNGLDDIEYIRSHTADIQEFRNRQEKQRYMSTRGA
ncbi:MAG: 3-isopropylmalate dehydratase small subunit [Candidatus Melainabacteria bacterium]|jgi:3-isopropylmalate/(R)-2-methylmalate dehydratase small subunit|nr:3-isopropylmalate dehydratase small subunit [Candidatus Melainabacteria bacterium]